MRTKMLGLALVGMLLAACATPTPTPTPIPTPTPTPIPTPTPDPMRAQVITFGKAIAAIETDSVALNDDSKTFLSYSSGMTAAARLTKYQELVSRFNGLKDRAAQISRPPIPEARAAHDKYLLGWSKGAQGFTLLNTLIQSGRALSPQEGAQIQALMDEATLLYKQFYELMDDLLAKYKLTRADVGLKATIK
ncbi:MAG: hypothetical protein HY687_04645 [Chloroflexi bacterium]|nr:hypothetical protein [Chloroflexota bacterium]